MSGLLDEAVEAMRDSLWATWGERRQTTDWPARWQLHQALEAALAALPAGVYVSDGQGKVRRIDTWNEMGTAWGETFSARRAALSATDTESSS